MDEGPESGDLPVAIHTNDLASGRIERCDEATGGTVQSTVIQFSSLLLLIACAGGDTVYESTETEPTRDFDVVFPEVDTDWPLGLDDDPPMDAVPFTGDWVDGFDTPHTITNDDWQISESSFAFDEVNAAEQKIIAQNGANNEWNPSLWSRFDWVVVDGATWYCQSAFDAESADAAREVPRADDSDPANTGCGGTFAWSRLYEPLPIRGDYVDGFDGSQVIREWQWTSGDFRFFVSDYSVDENWIVAQNASDNGFNPDKWSRFEWTEVDGELYYCQVAFDAETEADALAAGPADDTDPANGGCGAFAWSRLYVPLPIRGDYTDNFGGSQVIREWEWTSGDFRFFVSDYSIDENWIVAQNAPDNGFNPDKWSRFEWTEVEGQLYYCQVAFDAETEADALAAGPADASDPATTGCGGTFAWSALTPAE